MAFWSKKRKIEHNAVPRHIAIIMDGNGRWAKKRGLPRRYGHRVGAKVFRRIATYCKEIGVQYITVYAFSTENWKRPQDEVEAIMELLSEYLDTALAEFEENRIRLCFLGDRTPLSDKLKAKDVYKRQVDKCAFERIQLFYLSHTGDVERIEPVSYTHLRKPQGRRRGL